MSDLDPGKFYTNPTGSGSTTQLFEYRYLTSDAKLQKPQSSKEHSLVEKPNIIDRDQLRDQNPQHIIAIGI
jgi:hypothetical protein